MCLLAGLVMSHVTTHCNKLQHGNMSICIISILLLTMLYLCFSIEFDRDCDYFAIAGVTKKIKVFEYGTVIQDAVDIHYPVNEMTCNSKIRWGNGCRDIQASLRSLLPHVGTASDLVTYSVMSVFNISLE